MRKRVFGLYAAWIKKYYPVLLVLTVLSLIPTWLLAERLKIDTGLDALLPEDYESVKALREVEEKYGGVGTLMVVIESPDFQESLQFAESLSSRLRSNPKVEYAEYGIDRKFFEDRALLYADLKDLTDMRDRIRERIKYEKLAKIFPQFADPPSLDFSDIKSKYEEREDKISLPDGYYTDKDKQDLLVVVAPRKGTADVGESKKFLDEVRSLVDELNPKSFHPSMRVLFGGPVKNQVDQFETGISDIGKAAWISGVGVFVLTLIYFRSITTFFFAATPLGIAIFWNTALSYVLVGKLNIISSFLFGILFGLGVDYSFYMLSRYMEERVKGKDIEDSLFASLAYPGVGVLISGASTAAAFYALLVTDFKGFSELGFIAGNGIFCSIFSMFTVFPSLLVLGEKLKVLKVKPPQAIPFPGGDSKSKSKIPHRAVVIAFSILIFASFFLVPHIRFEYNFSKLRAEPRKTEEAKQKIGRIFTGSKSQAIVLTENDSKLRALVDRLNKIKRDDKESPTIDKVISILTFIPDEQDEKLEVIGEIKNLLEDDTLRLLKDKNTKDKIEEYKTLTNILGKVTYENLPISVKRPFMSRGNSASGSVVFIYPSVQLKDGKNAIAFAGDVGRIETTEGTFHAVEQSIILADILIAVQREWKIAMAIAFATVFLLVLIDFRNLKSTTLVLTPLVFSMFILGGLLVLLSRKVNLYNIGVFPALLGINDDYGVQMFQRYNEEGSGNLGRVMKTTGSAVLGSGLTSIAGFFGLLWVDYPGIRSLGFLAVSGILTSIITSLVFLPALLRLLEEISQRKKD